MVEVEYIHPQDPCEVVVFVVVKANPWQTFLRTDRPAKIYFTLLSNRYSHSKLGDRLPQIPL